jgi:putative transposase
MAARNYPLIEGAIFHSDRGTQYTSASFAAATDLLDIRRSVGATGVCFDNALAESFNATVKVERVNRTVYPTREHARTDVARYIEFRYDTRRLHSALGYQTPQEVYDEYLNRQSARRMTTPSSGPSGPPKRSGSSSRNRRGPVSPNTSSARSKTCSAMC